MRVLLIIPTYMYHKYPTFVSTSDFPVGFAYLASALKDAGHVVYGLNPNNAPGFSTGFEMLCKKLEGALTESKPDLIGIGGLCTDYHFIKDAIGLIRKMDPRLPVVCGGGIVTHDADFIFRNLSPDYCIIGEGEENLVQLADMIERGENDYQKIDNLGFWRDEKAVFTKANFKYGPVDRIAFPDYDPFDWDNMLEKFQLANRNLYRYSRINPKVMPIVAARGCPFSCTFCVHQIGVKYRDRSVENIMEEIGMLYEKYRFNVLVFLDELFAVKKDRLKKICRAFIDAKKNLGWDFDWTFQTHASASLNEDDFRLLKKAGCYLFSYGLESASPKVLTSMRKKTNPAHIAEGIKIANSAGIGYAGNLIFGDIAENSESISTSIDFFAKYCRDNHLFFAHIQPYPGSRLFDICFERGIIRDKQEFYETIVKKSYNMTSFPDATFNEWTLRMLHLGNSFLWVKATTATSFRKELENVDNPMVKGPGRNIWRIAAICPHCNIEVRIQEILQKLGSQKTETFFRTDGKFFKRAVQMYHREKDDNNALLVNLINFSIRLTTRVVQKCKIVLIGSSQHLSRWLRPRIIQVLHPRIFQSLQSLMPREGQQHMPISFITGCPSCNKRFRVNMPKTFN